MKIVITFILCCILISCNSNKQQQNNISQYKEIIDSISEYHGENSPGEWPRSITVSDEHRNWITGEKTKVTFNYTIPAKPMRIIPQSIGIAEILWAIVPRERIIAVHSVMKDKNISVLSNQITMPTFQSQETEKILSLNPDIVFVSSYSHPDFKKVLKDANILVVELGDANTIEKIYEQINLLGYIVGEEGNAKKLCDTMKNIIASYEQTKLRQETVLSYSPFYKTIAGYNTTFDSVCNALHIENLATKHNIEGFTRVEAEWILLHNPNNIIVTTEEEKKAIENDILLKESIAVKTNKIIVIPSQYLTCVSQFICLTIHALSSSMQ